MTAGETAHGPAGAAAVPAAGAGRVDQPAESPSDQPAGSPPAESPPDQPAGSPPERPALPAEQVDTAPGSGYPDRQALEGPFNTRQLVRLDDALRTADNATGLTFSVYVGELTDPSRQHAEKLHAQLPEPASAVLIAVAPNQRVLEIVTGALARRRLPDRDCRLAALSMVAAFGGGDIAGGILNGLAQLTNRARD